MKDDQQVLRDELNNFIHEILKFSYYTEEEYIDQHINCLLTGLLGGKEYFHYIWDIINPDIMPTEMTIWDDESLLEYLESKGYKHVQVQSVPQEASDDGELGADNEWGVFSLNGTHWFGSWLYTSYSGTDWEGLMNRIKVVTGRMKRVVQYVPEDHVD